MKRKLAKTEIRSFEVSLEKLKAIVSQLENGKLTLTESLERYEEGIKFLTECHDLLNKAQMKIEQLVKLDENGRLITKPFDDTASFDPSSSTVVPVKTSRRTSSGSYVKPPDAANPLRHSRLQDPESIIADGDLKPDEDWDIDQLLDDDELNNERDDEPDANSDFQPDLSAKRKGRPRSSEHPPLSQGSFLDFEEEE